MPGSFLTFDLLTKIEISHALLAVSMPNILLVVLLLGASDHYPRVHLQGNTADPLLTSRESTGNKHPGQTLCTYNNKEGKAVLTKRINSIGTNQHLTKWPEHVCGPSLI